LQRFDEKVDVAVVAFALLFGPRVAVGEYVADLADRHDCAARGRGALQKVAVGRRNGKILAVGGADELLRRRSDKGARDDAADVERIAEAARNAAETVKPFEPEGVLVRGDLQHGVRRGVADGLQRAEVLLAELLDDDRARGVTIAQNAGKPAFVDQCGGERLGEGGNSFREIAPVEVDRGSGDLKVAGGRILAARGLDSVTPLPARAIHGEAGRRTAGRGLDRVAEAERVEAWKAERPAPQPVPIAEAKRAGLGDMAERVGALVAVSPGVFRAAAADRVEHDDDGAGHKRLTSLACHARECGCGIYTSRVRNPFHGVARRA